MNAFLISTGIVSLAEIGDKTQLLALVLAARWRRPLTIISAIFLATLVNHGLAGGLGLWISHLLTPTTLSWILGIGFLLMAFWMLIPDKIDDDVDSPVKSIHGVFWVSFITFFVAEIGDKTQVATLGLVAEYQQYWAVVLGTTLGMLIVNAPTVFIGNKFAQRVPIAWLHRLSALVFLVLAIFALFRAITY